MKALQSIDPDQKTANSRFFVFTLLFIFSAFAASCGILGSDDEPDVVFVDGISPEIHDMIDEELLTVIEDSLKVPVHRGDSPPDIEALFAEGPSEKWSFDNVQNALGTTVVMKPLLMVETVVPDDRCENDGCNFWDLYIRLSEQDMANYTINLDTRHIQESEHTGLGGYIIGEDNRFSIFAEQTREREDKILKSVTLFSGIVTDEGIHEPHYAFIMVDNGDFDDLIPNGTGRSFVDGNDLAELTEWPETESRMDPGTEIDVWQLLLKSVK